MDKKKILLIFNQYLMNKLFFKAKIKLMWTKCVKNSGIMNKFGGG